VELFEFIAKLAEQHKNLLKVIELQNTSIQALNQRLGAMASAQVVMFAILLEATHADRRIVAKHLQLMLENPFIVQDPHLQAQLQDLQAVCQEPAPLPAAASGKSKTPPEWFKGVVRGGRAVGTAGNE